MQAIPIRIYNPAHRFHRHRMRVILNLSTSHLDVKQIPVQPNKKFAFSHLATVPNPFPGRKAINTPGLVSQLVDGFEI